MKWAGRPAKVCKWRIPGRRGSKRGAGDCISQFSHSVVSHSLLIPWTAARQASLSITNSWSLFKLMSIESVMPSNHLILCRPLLLPPSIFPSIRAFSKESVLHIRWPKDWSFSVRPLPFCFLETLSPPTLCPVENLLSGVFSRLEQGAPLLSLVGKDHIHSGSWG